MTFQRQLEVFVHAWCRGEEERREAFMRVRRLEGEILWCRAEIRKEEVRAARQPRQGQRAARRIADLTHQIRHREIEVAFASRPADV